MINTSFLYLKMIITTILSLYTTRIVLDILGVEDYGIYSLIAGVVTMISFLNGALMLSTQRYLSVFLGEGNQQQMKVVFNTSFAIHVIIAFLFFLLLEIIGFFLFDGFLKISPDKIGAAKIVYQIMVLSMLITIIGIPYNAAINAREELWFFAIVEVLAAILKLLAAFLLYYVQWDALIFYAYSLGIITFINVFLKYLWSKKRYEEARLSLRRYFSKKMWREIIGFLGWNTFGAVTQVGRTQGIAVVLNYFGGVVLNAAYGITNQVNSLLVYFSQIMTSAISPQIMKSKGEGNVNKMIYLSVLSSKLSFFLSAIIAVPLLIELPSILRIWLKNVPENTLSFCYYTMWIFLVMQLYPGLVRLLQADGRIKWFQIVSSILLLVPIPLGCVFFYWGFPLTSIFVLMIIAQLFTMIYSLICCKRYVGLRIQSYLLHVVLKPLISLFLALFICSRLTFTENIYVRLLMIVVVSGVFQGAFFYVLMLSPTERKKINDMLFIKK
jgi:O-antigen/teichoic acid export membrane protein